MFNFEEKIIYCQEIVNVINVKFFDFTLEFFRRIEKNMERRNSNVGAFSNLEIPIQKRTVRQICKKYGVDISFLKIKIQRDPELLKLPFAGMAAPEDIGRIDLTPVAFQNEEELLRTVLHEGSHVKQFKKYGVKYVQENRNFMEKVASRYEEFFYKIVKKR